MGVGKSSSVVSFKRWGSDGWSFQSPIEGVESALGVYPFENGYSLVIESPVDESGEGTDIDDNLISSVLNALATEVTLLQSAICWMKGNPGATLLGMDTSILGAVCRAYDKQKEVMEIQHKLKEFTNVSNVNPNSANELLNNKDD